MNHDEVVEELEESPRLRGEAIVLYMQKLKERDARIAELEEALDACKRKIAYLENRRAELTTVLAKATGTTSSG